MGRFCAAPWITISTDVNGSIRPCCRYEQPTRQTKYKMPWMKDGNILDLYNGQQMENLRNAFLRGEEPEECSWCWKEESIGVKSFRQKYQERRYSFDKEKPVPQILDLKLSNVCNLKCRMCGPQASSSIAKEENIVNPYWLSNKIIGTENEKTFFEEWLPNIKEIEFTGGEPFFSPENKELISRIVDSGHAEHIKILITTNAMFYIPSLMDKINRFQQINFSFSVDDIGKRLEYARGNSSWNLISENMKKIKNNYPRFECAIYRTINIFNIYYLNELDEWAMNEGITVSNGLLHEPKFLSIQYLPLWAKNEVLDKFERNNTYKEIVDFMNLSNNINQYNEMVNGIKEKDKIRKESFSEVFDEWAEILLWQ